MTLINTGEETVIHSPYFNDLKLLEGKVKIEINVANGFTFTILPGNPGYELIRPLKTLITVENMKTGKVEFDGRILMPTESMTDSGAFSKSYICESELGYLNDSAQRHGEYHDITVRESLQVMIDNHNADVAGDDIDKRFEVGIVDVDSSTGTLYRYLGYESTFDSIEDKLIDRLGGELRVRKENSLRYLDYVELIGEHKSTEIKLAKNLKSITKETDPSDIITRLIPLGERIESENEEDTDASEARLTIESVNNGVDYIDDKEAMDVFGVIAKSETWDDITQPGRLLTSGQKFLSENNRVKAKYKISALDLSLIDLDIDSFDVGNYYLVKNSVMNIDENLRVIGKTIDILDPENSSLDFGDRFMTASEYQNEANKSQLKVVKLEDTVERQSKRIVQVQEEVDNVNESLDELVSAFNEADVPAIEEAVSNLNDAVSDLTDAVDNIPDYDKATSVKDGLMSKEDKNKLNLISVLNSIDLDSLHAKLSLLSVTQSIDLDDLKSRVEDLENG